MKLFMLMKFVHVDGTVHVDEVADKAENSPGCWAGSELL